SFSNAWVGGSRVFAGGKGRFVGSARRGSLDLVLGFIDDGRESGETPDPRYWDAFAKLDRDLGARTTVSLEGLFAGDTADFIDSDDPADQFRIDSRWDNRHAGLTHQRTVGSSALVLTTLSAAVVDRDRDIHERAPREELDLDDQRRLDVFGLRHEWTVETGKRCMVSAGAELRRYDADYDYHNAFDLPDQIDDPRFYSRTGFVDYQRR